MTTKIDKEVVIDRSTQRCLDAIDRMKEKARRRREDHVIDPQVSLFGVTASRRRKSQLLLDEVRAAQATLDESKRQLFHERSPISYNHGYIPLPIEILLVTDIGNLEKLIFALLLRYSFGKGVAWPSEKRIAEELGKSVRQVQRAISNLEARGYIFITVKTVKGYRSFNSYTLNIQDISEISKKGRKA